MLVQHWFFGHFDLARVFGLKWKSMECAQLLFNYSCGTPCTSHMHSGQHSMVAPFYAKATSVTPLPDTAHEASSWWCCRKVQNPPRNCPNTALWIYRSSTLDCGRLLWSLAPATPFNNMTLAVALERLVCASWVCTILYVHR